MLVEGVVTECDFSQRRYDAPVQGAWVVAQGATGRWCTVMHVGPEYIRENGLERDLLTVAQAEREVDRAGGWLDIGEVVL